MMKRTTTVVIAAALLLAAGAKAQEPPKDQGEGPATATIARNCMGCHGVNGLSPGAIPTLYGKSTDFLVQRMTEFRDGKRDSTIMGRLLHGFADNDIRRLAEYFASRDKGDR